MSILAIQTRTGWGRVMRAFADWCHPQPGWLTLDVGCGPGLLPALLAQNGCHAFGVDLETGMLIAERLHPQLIAASAYRLPFPERRFDLVTASNLLFLLDKPEQALGEMRRLLRRGGQLALLNPSEHMSVSAASELAEQRGLQGLDRASLLDWAQRAEANQRWNEAGLVELFEKSGIRLVETALRVGPGLARLVRGEPG